jgi:hypothetical protein
VFEDFSYTDYLARQGVYSMLRRPRIGLIETDQGNPLWAALYAFKARGQSDWPSLRSFGRPFGSPLTSVINCLLALAIRVKWLLYKISLN